MLDLFVCHSPAEREVASAVAARLERGAEARVWLDENARETVAACWDGGLSSAGILLLLSPDSVPARATRAEWEGVLNHITGHPEPPLASLLVRECAYPALLERKFFFRWDPDPTAVLRALERWAVSLHALPERQSCTPAALPWFEGREGELDRLWRTLVDGAGCAVLVNASPGSGKTSLAQEFARQAGGHFRDILWVDCGGRTRLAIAGDLAAQLGVRLEGPPARALAHLGPLVSLHRVLLVLDDLQGPLPWEALPPGLASVLITTRQPGLELPPGTVPIELECISPAGFAVPTDHAARLLWQAMAVCRPGGFPLELAARIAGLESRRAREVCDRLAMARVADPFDAEEPRARLNAASRGAAGGSGLERRHAEALRAERYAGCAAEMEAAVEWALTSDWTLAVALARRAVAWLQDDGCTTAAVPLLERLRVSAEARGDIATAEYCNWELSWIEDRPVLGIVTGEQLSLELGV